MISLRLLRTKSSSHRTTSSYRPKQIIRYSSSVPPYTRPSPPPLPAKEQREWEELIRRRELPAAEGVVSQTEQQAEMQLHPDARQPVRPDFEGDTNPKTGEIGGPKKEPLQWGASGEWTYGGRATDF
ncbi:hypothetical protein BU17DRAFT_69634 [Hysterangium stoloniferum]|nr:hypothetical protein BU17DRAFT_69634 [Hysterangium stoloniferum]